MGEGSRRAELLPAVLILGMVLWIFTTTGGDEIFVSEVLSRAYDSQAEHFLHGDVGVDLNAIVHEVLIVDGKTRMYFGPFPAFLRIPPRSSSNGCGNYHSRPPVLMPRARTKERFKAI
jgi:hypothetical protein